MDTKPLSRNRPGPGFTLKDHWLDHALAGIECIGVLTHQTGKPNAYPLEAPGQFVDILNQILDQRYDFEPSSQASPMTSQRVISTQPQLQDGDEYLLIRLNVFTEMGRRASMPFGGIVYEDPFWAVLAAFELGYRRSRLAAPRAERGEGLWEQVPRVIESVAAQSYQPASSFDFCLHAIPSGADARFSLITADAPRLVLLREKARCVIPGLTGGAIYQLYSPRS